MHFLFKVLADKQEDEDVELPGEVLHVSESSSPTPFVS